MKAHPLAQLAELLSGGPPTLVFVQEQWRTGQRIIALFDGSAASEVALQTAAALIDALSGFQIWSGRYDRELSDLFALQDEITFKYADGDRVAQITDVKTYKGILFVVLVRF